MSKTVFILGAGATRGCSFVADKKRAGRCLPPLDTDFFTQLQRVSNRSHAPLISRLIEGLVNWFGPNYALGMEQVFCHLEQAERMLGHLKEDIGPDYENVVSLKRDLVQSIAIILGEALTSVHEGGRGSYGLMACGFHDKLVSQLADSADAFISFNYDCVLDDSLRRCGDGKWHPQYGYGIEIKGKVNSSSRDNYWAPLSAPLESDATIQVHKVHGSLHFDVSNDGTVKLKQRPYGNPRAAHGAMKFTIIPPESSKSYNTGTLGEIMRGAYRSLRAATRVVVIGYSLPPSDQHAEALLRFGVTRESLESLVIVNPDQVARRRIRTAIQQGLKPATRILSFDYLEEFVNSEPLIWKVG